MMRATGFIAYIQYPSNYGIGCFSKKLRFVDQLAAGQKYWQILPLGPTGYGIPLPVFFPHLQETSFH